MKNSISIKEFSKGDDPLVTIENEDQIPLPPPFDKLEEEPPIGPLKDDVIEKMVRLDDTVLVNIPKPKTKEEEEELVNKFLSGLRKLFEPENNWTFQQQTTMSMEHCAKCQTCNEACHIYEESNHNDLYRPTFRSEILRRIYFKYINMLSKVSPVITQSCIFKFKSWPLSLKLVISY